MATPEETLFEIVVRSVPQWYLAEVGPYSYQLNLDGYQKTFHSQRAPTPSLKRLLEWVNEHLPIWKASLPTILTPASITRISEELALHWLSIRSTAVEWARLLAYCDDLRLQSDENASVSRNLIVSPGAEGHGHLADPALVKPFAKLGGSGYTYFRVDGALRPRWTPQIRPWMDR